MTLSERVAYLKGLAEGMELGDSKQEKLLKEIIGVLENVASDMLDVEDDIIDIGEQVDEIDEDLAALEDEVYYEDDEDDDDDEEDDDDDLFYEVTCPSCNDTICLDEETILDGSYVVQRPFVLVTMAGTELSEAAQNFFDYITSDEVKEIILDAGVVPAKQLKYISRCGD